MPFSLKNAFNRLFGRPMSAEEVIVGAVNIDQDAIRVELVGVGPGGVRLPIVVDADGKLDVGMSFSGTVSVSTVSFNQTTPGTTNGVVVNSSALPAGAATQTTLAAILTKLADPATETTLAAVLAKLIAAPATEARQTTGNVSLASIDTKITACNTGAVVIASSALPTGAATQTTLASLDGKVTACNTGAVVVASGAITSTPVTLTRDSSSGYVASEVVKASAGSLFAVMGYNSGPTQFIQLHNTTSLPANGSVPILLLGVPAASSFAFDFGGLGLPCSTGMTLAVSSTGPTLTVGSANVFFTSTFL